MTGPVSDLYPLAPDTIARAEALIAAHAETWRNKGAGCRCGWTCVSCPPGAERTRHATHVVQVLAAAGLLASLAHLDEPRPVDAPAPPSNEWENGFSEAWNAIARHHGSREERDLADLLRDHMTTDDGIGQRYVRADDDMFVDAARQVLEAGWFRTECCRFCAPSAREHDTDEGHTHGESCCLYLPAQDQAAARERIATLSRLLRGMARRVGQWRETASLLDDPDAVSAISEGQMAVEAGETFTLDGRPAPRPARRTTPFAASRGPRVFSDGGY